MNYSSIIILSEIMPLGGTSNFAMNLCQGMLQAGCWRGVAATIREPSEILQQFNECELPVIAPKSSLHLHEDRIEHLYRECARFSPSAVVGALGASSFDFLRYVPSGCLRIAMIQSDDQKVYEAVIRYINWVDIVVGVSSEICRKIKLLLPRDSDVQVIHQPYGVPMPEYAIRNKPCNCPIRILYLGRVIDEQKRVNLMARVMAATLAANQNLTWTIAGDGPQLLELRKKFASTNNRVHFLGAVSYVKVPDILMNHDVYFLCSEYEGLPLSLLEAMGMGLVPVVSDLPSGISEVVHKDNGIRIAINDEQGYVNAILKLASEPEIIHAYSKQAINSVHKSYSTAAMTQRWQEMLDLYGPSKPPIWKNSCSATVPAEVAHKWHLKPWLRPMRSFLKRLRL